MIYDIYYDLLIDNKNFHESRRSEAYWHGERAILLFVKSPLDFYFADILFGKEREDFLLVNNILNKTFPNTITLLQEIEDKKKGTRTDYIKTISSNQNLRHFFYPKSNIAEFLIEAYDLTVGDRVLIQGPTTGSQEMFLESMRVAEKPDSEKASKSDVVTFKTEFKVRPSDKLYKIVAAD